MDQVRKSKNFLRNFLTREQKILLKFDQTNIVDDRDSDDSQPSDFDEIITENLSSDMPLV